LWLAGLLIATPALFLLGIGSGVHSAVKGEPAEAR
jgi:hypothetical protein